MVVEEGAEEDEPTCGANEETRRLIVVVGVYHIKAESTV